MSTEEESQGSNGTGNASFWVAIAEAIVIVGATIEELVRNCCKKRREASEETEVTVKIAETKA